MKEALFLNISAILMIGLFTGIIGCGEDEEEAARMLKTSPDSGGVMFTNGNLMITFDRTVTEVWVNGIPADVAGTKATWKGQWLEAGKQILRIEWTDENGNTNSEEITLTIQEADTIICFRLKGEENEGWLYADGRAQGRQRRSCPLA